ncbi:MAG: nucleotide exchange factor GrpE, partial [Acidobacteriota bacterium]
MSGQSVNNDQPDRGTAPEATEPKAGSAELTTVEASAPPEAAQREAAEAEGKSENVLERLTSDLEDVRDLLRRKQAEFENFRKRVERERKDFIAYASANVITEILPVLDNLERAVE